MDASTRRYLLVQGVAEHELYLYLTDAELADSTANGNGSDDNAADQGDQDEPRGDDDDERLERAANQIARRRHGMTTEELAYRARRGEEGAEGKLQAVYKAAARRSGYRGGMLSERAAASESERGALHQVGSDEDLQHDVELQLLREGTTLQALSDQAARGDAEAARQVRELYAATARALNYRGA